MVVEQLKIPLMLTTLQTANHQKKNLGSTALTRTRQMSSPWIALYNVGVPSKKI